MSTHAHRSAFVRLGVLLSLTTLACAAPAPSTHRAEPRSQRTEISRAEIEAVLPHVGNAFELIERLRPGMFLSREPWRANASANAFAPESGLIVVYVDGLRHGGIETLERIPARSVVHIERLSQTDASFRYGGGHKGGRDRVVDWGARREAPLVSSAD